MKIIGIIPARFGSTRFPGKPLAEIQGQSMITRVIERARKCPTLSSVIVATDDERIERHVREFGGEVIMTSAVHPSGTDRCLEALEKSGLDVDAVINIQGDEPFVDPSQIGMLCDLMAHGHAQIATLAKRIDSPEVLFDPNKVKVVMDQGGRALYFSRQAIPYRKGVDPERWTSGMDYYKHLGLYAFRVDVLREIGELHPSSLELAESLEQLRWLQAGYSIHVGITTIETPAIDTPEDLERLMS